VALELGAGIQPLFEDDARVRSERDPTEGRRQIVLPVAGFIGDPVGTGTSPLKA
jgi:hypothetical protein